MTVEVDRDALVAGVRSVIDVVAGRCTIPILANLLLDVSGGQFTITGADLDMQAASTIEASGELSTTVDAQKLLAAASSFKPGKLTLTPNTGKSGLVLRQGRGQRTLQTLPAADFPKREPLTNAKAFSIPAASLSRILDTTHFAQSRDETRYYLIGSFLHVAADKLKAAATDGHRLISVEVPLPEGAAGMPDTIVPASATSHLRKLLAKFEGSVAVEVTAKAMTFTVGATRIITNVVDGTFPDYSRVIPPQGAHSLTTVRDALVEPVAAVTAVINAEGDKFKVRSVAFDLGGADGHLVRSRDQMGTTASEPLDGDLDGAPIEFGVNAAYFRSVVGAFAEKARVTINTSGPASPLRFTSDKDPDLIGVVMPMRI
ncbi:DNA polymerase III subunit beta [Sphingomonas sp. KR1UV-12]|uniref:Beta sliding clamp n=1 Tax=Sphingomonas aurea TaxID=3063994 RepID=A0ABT9EHC7_9SPHN|nr:DNA polymerase III subunit beta [Sphingomonas sp. KR1UV-12]MDP1026376.1 DNA polymerase III subunit beta [Sphingomonas sp. KR1UV-12]